MIPRVLLERTPMLLHCACYAMIGCLFIQFPSLWLMLAVLGYGGFRSGGMGEQLGHREMQRVDAAVMGGMLLMVGCYALACRAVALSGLVSASVITGIYASCAHKLTPRPTVLMGLTIALAWTLIAYRWFNPTNAWSWFGCCNGVG